MYRTAEAVAAGHPDKVCDQIADAILDAYLKEDPKVRAAIEVMGGHGMMFVTGELTTRVGYDQKQIMHRVIGELTKLGQKGIKSVLVNLGKQSVEIGRGVDNDGAGDQGIMTGFATSETEEMMPLEVVLARKLVRVMGLRDGKAQVTVEGGRVQSFITSVCGELSKEDTVGFEKAVREIIKPHLAHDKDIEDAWLRNPNGEWTIGGFAADAGLTGRKLAVDLYGPNIPIGGGALSGKDATKVDRSGAYMARKIAVDYLRKYGAREVYVHLAYAIGVAEPVMAVATIDGKQTVVEGYDLRPRAIIERFELEKPRFQETARYGQVGNGFSWDE